MRVKAKAGSSLAVLLQSQRSILVSQAQPIGYTTESFKFSVLAPSHKSMRAEDFDGPKASWHGES